MIKPEMENKVTDMKSAFGGSLLDSAEERVE